MSSFNSRPVKAEQTHETVPTTANVAGESLAQLFLKTCAYNHCHGSLVTREIGKKSPDSHLEHTNPMELCADH